MLIQENQFAKSFDKVRFKVKKVKARMASAKELIIMSIFKLSIKVLPPHLADKMMGLPHMIMGLNGSREKELLEKYFSQTAEESRHFVASMNFVKFMAENRQMDIRKSAIFGKEAPNTVVFHVNGGHEGVGILDLQRKNRPLILNFGSCS